MKYNENPDDQPTIKSEALTKIELFLAFLIGLILGVLIGMRI